MKTIEGFFRAHKIIFLLFALLAAPFALVWAIIYGLIIGIVGPIVDTYEIIRNRTYQDVRSLLKYPKWKAELFQKITLRNLDNNLEKMQETRKAFEEGRKKTPGPTGYLFQNVIVFTVFYFLLFLLWGIITGPIRAFSEYLKWCYKIWTGHWYVPI